MLLLTVSPTPSLDTHISPCFNYYPTLDISTVSIEWRAVSLRCQNSLTLSKIETLFISDTSKLVGRFPSSA